MAKVSATDGLGTTSRNGPSREVALLLQLRHRRRNAALSATAASTGSSATCLPAGFDTAVALRCRSSTRNPVPRRLGVHTQIRSDLRERHARPGPVQRHRIGYELRRVVPHSIAFQDSRPPDHSSSRFQVSKVRDSSRQPACRPAVRGLLPGHGRPAHQRPGAGCGRRRHP